MIAVENFSKTYGSTRAVHSLTFRVSPGTILGLVGPNGAGKTTTLKALSGVVGPTQGTLSLFGVNVASEPIRAKRLLGYVPDDPPLFSDLTVDGHLAFTAAAYAVAHAESRAKALLDEFDLYAKRRTPAGELSRGMRQKLAVCCAFLHNPPVLLFDEPLTGLDPAGIRTLKRAIVRRAQDGVVVVSSHLLAMVEDLCTHVLILHGGRQRFFGPLDDLRTSFVEDTQVATLENIFFLATQESAALAPSGP